MLNRMATGTEHTGLNSYCHFPLVSYVFWKMFVFNFQVRADVTWRSTNSHLPCGLRGNHNSLRSALNPTACSACDTSELHNSFGPVLIMCGNHQVELAGMFSHLRAGTIHKLNYDFIRLLGFWGERDYIKTEPKLGNFSVVRNAMTIMHWIKNKIK